VAPYETFGTPELARAVGEALEGRTAALMSNHGTVAHGADVDSAVRATELLEWAANVYWHACALGVPRVLDSDQLQAVVEAATARRYGSMKAAS
jgi:L-fuculose-phosphate aldolase